MKNHREMSSCICISWLLVFFTCIVFGSVSPAINAQQAETGRGKPTPLLDANHPVDWWFVFKFNAHVFPGCSAADKEVKTCPFGGNVASYPESQQFAVASSDDDHLKKGGGCLGQSTEDPVGASFDEIYNGTWHYVIWNDQFYGDPAIPGCSGNSCGSPWGHSKGALTWDEDGNGFVMQVTTPSWPASGNHLAPRHSDGNTLGCVKDDDVEVSQHFFALRLTKQDVVKVLQALVNASVVTDPMNRQIVSNGGPADIQRLVNSLGHKSHSSAALTFKLSTGIELISKPSDLHVPPWQLVSAEMGGVGIKAATWWTKPEIPDTTLNTSVDCWDASLGRPGPVTNASSGQWRGMTFSLQGGLGEDHNHAKVGVSTSSARPYTIFGDLNQQGSLATNCGSSQNGRGGIFFVLQDAVLRGDVAKLLGDN